MEFEKIVLRIIAPVIPFTMIVYFIYKDIFTSVVLGVILSVEFGIFLTILIGVVKDVRKPVQTVSSGYCDSRAASYMFGDVSVGGRIYLYNERLEFIAHSFNIYKESLTVPYKDIKDVRYKKGVPGIVCIVLKSGDEFSFIVKSGQQFKERLTKNYLTA